MQIQMLPFGEPDKVFKDPAKLFTVLTGVVRDQVAEGVRYMSWYPPAPPNSRYIRQGTLRRSWQFNVATGGGRIEGTVGSQSNIAPYNEDVQGENQLDVFREIGWRTTTELQQQFDRTTAQKVQDEISKYFD